MGKIVDTVERLLTGATTEERAALHAAFVRKQVEARGQALVDDLEAHFDEDVREEQALANLESLRDVPDDVLPDGPARTALVWLMSLGGSVYVYASGGPTTGTWCVWVDPLASARFGGYGRVPIATWCAHWPELLAEMSLSLPA